MRRANWSVVLVLAALCGCDHRRAVSLDGLLASPDARPDAAIIKDCKHPPVKQQCSDGWCRIPAGCFVMGSPVGERCRPTYHKETQHRVLLTRSFDISQTEVTMAQFKAVMGYKPAHFFPCADTCPAFNVSWYEAVAYCNQLSKHKGLEPCYANTGSKKTCSTTKGCLYPEVCVLGRCSVFGAVSKQRGSAILSCTGYRLPTEAEFEYAYRAGTKTAYYNGPVTHCLSNTNADAIAWYYDPSWSQKLPHLVGLKQPNGWGLYDMAGNVGEWCHDRHTRDLGSTDAVDPGSPPADPKLVNPDRADRIIRGGSWAHKAGQIRAADRSYKMLPTGSYETTGFRCARSR